MLYSRITPIKFNQDRVAEIKAEPKRRLCIHEWKGDGNTEQEQKDNPLKIKVDKNMKLEVLYLFPEDELVFYTLNSWNLMRAKAQ